jgi:hypothetical protein
VRPALADACARRARDHAATALERAGAAALAVDLRDRATPRQVCDAVRAAAPPETARIAVTMAGDAARRALGGAAVVAAYIAAHTAARVDGAGAVRSERNWQADWLGAELSLRA